MSTTTTPQTIYLKDYRPTPFAIDHIHMNIDLHEDQTLVTSLLHISKRADTPSEQKDLILNGEELTLKSIKIDGHALNQDQYNVSDDFLTVLNAPEKFTLETVIEIHPELNKQLSGLYASGGNFCTQCEPEGFRRITYFYDRPDVLTHFTTTITADKTKYPALLANGNLSETRDLDNNRHWAKWEDPSLKPCYLFALVAGDFDLIEDTFLAADGNTIDLRFYLEKGFGERAYYALESLKRSMKWDEETFGRIYDLNNYMVVAVSDFNMGAMENKGLNIFNTKYVLADQNTATDADYMNIERVIGHEYFHNWSGNRVTCRDWFQITLKEGLTVLREQLFCEDMTGHARVRIQSANTIRNVQFAQDAGPMSHPIRPEEYIEMNNFYTVTVYEKGSEVIRMVRTFLGKEAFRKAMDLYFDRHDGQAVTTEDFIQAMQDSSGFDLSQFKRWYAQAGTPIISVTTDYNPKAKTLTLHLEQTLPNSNNLEKHPLMMPIAMSLLNHDGKPLEIAANASDIQSSQDYANTWILNFHKHKQSFEFSQVESKPLISFLRDFSAPIKVALERSHEDLIQLIEHDTDPFAKWDAAQQVMSHLILTAAAKDPIALDDNLMNQFTAAQKTMLASDLAHDLKALMLSMPSERFLLDRSQQPHQIQTVHSARGLFKKTLALALQPEMLTLYNDLRAKPYDLDLTSISDRDLKNTLLAYLVSTGDAKMRLLALGQFRDANNMTDKMGSLAALNGYESDERQKAMALYLETAKDDALMLDKWLALEASLPGADTIESIEAIMSSDYFDLMNPNKVRALLGAFSHNLTCFHQTSGEGYRLLADQVLALDPHNRLTAARLVEPLIRYKSLPVEAQNSMRTQLKRIKNTDGLSKDTFEVVSKALK
jgi:aminopeptidase N